MRTISCIAARANGISSIAYVTGDHWIVATRSTADQAQIATTLNGQSGIIHC
jgi:hypothetical protein